MDSKTRAMIRHIELRKNVAKLRREHRGHNKKERDMIQKVNRAEFNKLSLSQKLALVE